MGPPCKKIKYKKKRSSKPIIKVKKPPPSTVSSPSVQVDSPKQIFYPGEDDGGELPPSEISIKPQKTTAQLLREWVMKQRFIPQDLSDELLSLFLSAAGFDVDLAAEKMQTYFFSRQEPSYLFRDRDPLSPENAEILKKLYVLPMPDTTQNGSKIILVGLTEPSITYNQLDHAKMFALVIDLLIWEKDFGFGDFIVVIDGRNFLCPHLLQNKISNHRSITSLLLDTIPGTLRSLYFLYPPHHVAKVADNRNGIWMTVVKTKQELISHLPADILPLEFGGNLGHVGDLLEQWILHLAASRDFFIHFEKRMTNDYRRRLCHEKEVTEGGKNWVHKMKLEADEWEYKIQYYERMKNAKPLKHPAFGSQRLLNVIKPKPAKDPLEKCRKLAKEEEEKDKIFEPPKLYNGYAKQIRMAKLLEQLEYLRKLCEMPPLLEIHIL